MKKTGRCANWDLECPCASKLPNRVVICKKDLSIQFSVSLHLSESRVLCLKANIRLLWAFQNSQDSCSFSSSVSPEIDKNFGVFAKLKLFKRVPYSPKTLVVDVVLSFSFVAFYQINAFDFIHSKCCRSLSENLEFTGFTNYFKLREVRWLHTRYAREAKNQRDPSTIAPSIDGAKIFIFH